MPAARLSLAENGAKSAYTPTLSRPLARISSRLSPTVLTGVRIDPRPRGSAVRQAASPASSRAPSQPHCDWATVSSQERIAQIASWLRTPSNGGM